MSVYPNAIDGYQQIPLARDGVTKITSQLINSLRSAIINIETELGLNPKGDYNTLSERLDELESNGGGTNSGLEQRLDEVETDLADVIIDLTNLTSDFEAILLLIPTSGEKEALVGTDGIPSSSNPYVTDSDPRLISTSLSDGDKGDITVSSSGSVWTVDNDAITFAKMQNISSGSILGRTTASSGNIEELTAGSGISISGGQISATGGSISDGDKGDITVSSSGTVWTVDNSAISYSKIQNISSTDRILGRFSSGAGIIEEITCTSAGRDLLDDANASAQRTTLGLGTAATSASTDFLSSSSSSTQSGYFGDIYIVDDTNPSHYLIITNLDDLSANRTLSLTLNNSNRTIDLSGNLTVSGSATISGTNTGDQTITLSGDVTGSGTSGITTTIANDAVTYAKMQNISAEERLLGRGVGSGAGDTQEISLGGGLSISGTTLSNDIINGEFLVLNSHADLTNESVFSVGALLADTPGVGTYQIDVSFSATQRIAGRNSSGSGVGEEVTITQALDWIGSTRGSILYRGASGWAILTPGTSTYVLTSNGAGADPSWEAGGSSLSDGDKGDITVSSSGSVWTVDNDAITFAKMQNISSGSILGRTTASSGNIEELTAGSGISISGGQISATGVTTDAHAAIMSRLSLGF